MFEKKAFSKGSGAGVKSVERQATNDAALKAYYQKNFGGNEGVDDFLTELNTKHAQMGDKASKLRAAAGIEEGKLAGGNIQTMQDDLVTKIKANKKVARKQVEDIYDLLPNDLEVNSQRMLQRFDDIGQPTSTVEHPDNFPDVLKRIQSQYQTKLPQEVEDLVTSFTAKGKPLPDGLKKLIEQYAPSTTIPLKQLRGIRTEILNELDRAGTSLTGRNPAKIKRLVEMLKATEGTKADLAKAGALEKDVVDVYEQASAAWTNYKNTFEIDDVAAVLQRGKGGKLKLSAEQTAQRVFNSKNVGAADQFNAALGEKRATGLVKEYADYDVLQNAIDPVTKEINPNKLATWLNKHKNVLKKYNLQDSYKGLLTAKESVRLAQEGLVAFEKSQAAKMLGVDPDKAVRVAFAGKGGKASAQTARELLKMAEGNPAAQAGIKRAFIDDITEQFNTTAKNIEGTPIISVAKFNKIYGKYEPALKEFFKGEQTKLNALRNMKKAYEIMIRNKVAPVGGGADTFENLASALGRTVGHAPIGGPMKIRALRSVARIATSFTNSQVEAVLSRAIFDPDMALTLNLIASGLTPEIAVKRWAGHVARVYAGYARNKAEGKIEDLP